MIEMNRASKRARRQRMRACRTGAERPRYRIILTWTMPGSSAAPGADVIGPGRHALAPLLSTTGVMFVHGRATALDLAGKRVRVEGNGGAAASKYDSLVYALGSVADLDRTPGVRGHTLGTRDGRRGCGAGGVPALSHGTAP